MAGDTNEALHPPDSPSTTEQPKGKPGWLGAEVIFMVALGVVLAMAVWHHWRGHGDSLADNLPEDTLVWVRYSEPGKLTAGTQQRAAVGKLVALLRNGEAAVEFLEGNLDLHIGPDAASESLGWLGLLRTVDIVFQGVGIEQGAPMPKLLIILEFHRKKDLRGSAERLGEVSEEDRRHSGVVVYSLNDNMRRKLDMPFSPCYAVTGTRLLVSLEQDALADQLGNLGKPPENPLAETPAYRRVAKRTKRSGNRVWMGGELIDELVDLVPKREQLELNRVLKAIGADALQGMYFGGDRDSTGRDKCDVLVTLVGVPRDFVGRRVLDERIPVVAGGGSVHLSKRLIRAGTICAAITQNPKVMADDEPFPSSLAKAFAKRCRLSHQPTSANSPVNTGPFSAGETEAPQDRTA